jgi:hypothetical protein
VYFFIYMWLLTNRSCVWARKNKMAWKNTTPAFFFIHRLIRTKCRKRILLQHSQVLEHCPDSWGRDQGRVTNSWSLSNEHNEVGRPTCPRSPSP